jgi:WD40 repeat protein
VYDLAPRPAREGSLPVVASVGQDRTVRFWQPSIGRLMRFTRIPEATPLSAAWLPDGSRLVVGCSDGRVLWIDPDTSQIVQAAAVHSGWCYCVAAHPGTGQVVAGGPDGIRMATPETPAD